LQKRIAILGSTGSIGCNALEVIERLGPGYRAVALSAHRQADKLLEQARRSKPEAVALCEEAATPAVRRQFAEMGIQVHAGPQGLVELATRPDVDIILAAVVGAAGLPAVLAGVRAGKTLALANKESLVVAGSLVMAEARRRGVPVLPVDSEHSAIFQAMQCGSPRQVSRIILTASGGPFRCATREQIEGATLADALNHPTWRMGTKVTIDSATMFNKALEIIEACWLFDLPPEKVEVVIHPESIVHSMVEFIDGSVLAQLSPPDMRTPIQYALTYPQRAEGLAKKLDLKQAFTLRFEPPDFDRFPALGLAYSVAKLAGTSGAVLNAANEVAVEAFASGKITFGQISRLVGLALQVHLADGFVSEPALEDLMAADQWSRHFLRERVLESRL
jgi:1-deoxy-D-xylulose-5-phosphate reductoisomerase